MAFKLSEQELRYIDDSIHELTGLLEQLCRIPAPSNHEEKRAEFCKGWLERQGAEGVYIDEALNVVYPVNCGNDITVFAAHTDTVFPDTSPMPYHIDNGRIYSPGVGDNTVSLAIMMMVIKYMLTYGITPKRGILFVANSGEEGLGNLKGITRIMKDYAGRISEVFAFDGQYAELVDKCVGSHRHRVEVLTEGGHSFRDFGNKNAIYYLSRLINALYRKEAPRADGCKTTYNVGTIEGGTSVNTIAQQAHMLYEYRSDAVECLDLMRTYFESEIEKLKNEGVAVNVEMVGSRPCMRNVDLARLDRMARKCADISAKHSGKPCLRRSGSTDCNIPMSMGIPAVCVGLYEGGGAHTRGEWIERGSMPVGMKIAAELILSSFE